MATRFENWISKTFIRCLAERANALCHQDGRDPTLKLPSHDQARNAMLQNSP